MGSPPSYLRLPMEVLRVRRGSTQVSPRLLPQTTNGSTQSTAWEYPCFPRCEASESPVRVLRVRQCIRLGRGPVVARCRHGPDHHREPGHPPFAGTADYPCEYSEYPMGVPRLPHGSTQSTHQRGSGPPPRAGAPAVRLYRRVPLSAPAGTMGTMSTPGPPLEYPQSTPGASMEEYRGVPLQYRKPAHLPSAGTRRFEPLRPFFAHRRLRRDDDRGRIL